MTVRALIFDLDGTLLDTLEDLADSMNAVLTSEGFVRHPVDAYRYFVGDGVEMLVRRAMGLQNPEDRLVRHCMRRMEEEYGRRWANKARRYPEIDELLDELEKRALPKAIFSNKPEAFTHLIVEQFLAGWQFAAIRGARPDFPKKPDPAGALEIAAQWAIEPSDILYLGDTNTDMKTAGAAGMFAVGATWGFRPAAELAASGADRLVEHPLEVLACL
jgi:phosphoglycolate phosphatase